MQERPRRESAWNCIYYVEGPGRYTKFELDDLGNHKTKFQRLPPRRRDMIYANKSNDYQLIIPLMPPVIIDNTQVVQQVPIEPNHSQSFISKPNKVISNNNIDQEKVGSHTADCQPVPNTEEFETEENFLDFSFKDPESDDVFMSLLYFEDSSDLL
ncbi:hypothetical protein M9Y10_038806 [Tritrichomonas musculus]|uniref:Uncharacterized protein n=1 Tax=Tritrichomonas musculus TaxID=1915356 RepID=A0ABR2KAF9_9EUKA